MPEHNGPAWGPARRGGNTVFRLWAPACERLSLALGHRTLAMSPCGEGWFEVETEGRPFGEAYGFILEDGHVVTDPASRMQSLDVDDLAVLTDPDSYAWQNESWRGRPWHETVIHEIHIGTFTPEGTFLAAIGELPRLAALGITAIELMPVAHFPGRRGWGYDGVLLYAPHSAYGRPDDLKALVDAAHGLGLMVFLDVVYNHFGPEGNYLSRYAPDFFCDEKHTPWGRAIDYEQPAVRRYFIDNVLYWLGEFRFDGLRFDAVDRIADGSDKHILEEISEAVKPLAAGREIHLIVENPNSGTDMLAAGHYVADWNDDFHHVIHRIVTGEDTGHYEKFRANPHQKLRLILAEGYLHPGTATIGENLPPPASLRPISFIHFLQNHDQAGNRALGERLHMLIDPARYRALMTLLLLSPQIPLTFMGEDFLSDRTFHYFSDYSPDIAAKIRTGRPAQAAQFGSFHHGISASDIADPGAPATFMRSQINHGNRPAGADAWTAFMRELLATRRRHIMPLLPHARGYSGTVIEGGEGSVFIDWTLGDTVLHLRANLSDREIPAGTLTGTRISGSCEAGGVLGPWEVAFFTSPLPEPANRPSTPQ